MTQKRNLFADQEFLPDRLCKLARLVEILALPVPSPHTPFSMHRSAALAAHTAVPKVTTRVIFATQAPLFATTSCVSVSPRFVPMHDRVLELSSEELAREVLPINALD